jgi:hypothetical protein
VGSVAADRSGTLIAASSPRAGSIVILDAVEARILAAVPLPDGCGLAAGSAAHSFVATSGGGAVQALIVDGGDVRCEPLRIGLPRWDNHLRRLDFG